MKSVFITGGGSGIGLEVAKIYLSQGWRVGCASMEDENLVPIIDEITYYQLDVTNADLLRESIRSFFQEFGSLDLVIANAGINHPKTPLPNFQRNRKVFEVNVFGVMNTFEPAIEIMKKQGYGHIATMSSLSGIIGLPGMSGYGASKAAVISMCESLACDLIKVGIYVSVAAPGFVKSNLTADNKHSMPFMITSEQAAHKIVKMIEKKKFISFFPHPLSWVCRFLSILPRPIYLWVMRNDFLGLSKN